MMPERKWYEEPKEKLQEKSLSVAYDAGEQANCDLNINLRVLLPSHTIDASTSAFDFMHRIKSERPASVLTVRSNIQPEFWQLYEGQIEMLSQEFDTPLSSLEIRTIMSIQDRQDLNFLQVPVLLRLLKYPGKICSIVPEPPTLRKIESYLEASRLPVTTENFSMIDAYRSPYDNKIFYMEPFEVSETLGRVWKTTLTDNIHEAFKLALVPQKHG